MEVPRSRWPGVLRRHLFGIAARETRFEHRGFALTDPTVVTRLERVGTSFVAGYHAAMLDDDADALAARLAGVHRDMQGFAYEGAAMALTLLDRLTPWRRGRLASFVKGAGGPHVYMVHVGAGWAMARLRIGVARSLERLDPLLRWLALDGYGFHEAYFHPQRTVREHQRPAAMKGYARRAFDQGVGRSLWFVEGADPQLIAGTIERFPAVRHSDLWSGIGLAATYAGAVEAPVLEALTNLAAGYRRELAQGAAFAAKARERAGNPVPHTEIACRVLCHRSLRDAAAVTDNALIDLPVDAAEPAYEVWRRRIREQLEVAG